MAPILLKHETQTKKNLWMNNKIICKQKIVNLLVKMQISLCMIDVAPFRIETATMHCEGKLTKKSLPMIFLWITWWIDEIFFTPVNRGIFQLNSEGHPSQF